MFNTTKRLFKATKDLKYREMSLKKIMQQNKQFDDPFETKTLPAGEFLLEEELSTSPVFCKLKNESIVEIEKNIFDSSTQQINRCYIASGWFNPEWLAEVEGIKQVLTDLELDYFSPKDFAICAEDAAVNTQKAIYDGNIENLITCDWMIANTRLKDQGTHVEAGRFSGMNKEIVYFCAGLPPGAQFNLMLAQSGVKVCTSLEELHNYLSRCKIAGRLLHEPYQGKIQ